MNAFNNHTTIPKPALSAGQLIATLNAELVAADTVLSTVRPFLSLSQLLHIMVDLQQRGVIDHDALRAPERSAVLAMACAYRVTAAPLRATSAHLVHRLRTVAGQSTIKPPALDLEAADHIEQLVKHIEELTGKTGDVSNWKDAA
jgi:hypothetical protein